MNIRTPIPATTETLTALAEESVALMATGDRAEFARIYHPEFANREARVEPPAARGTGPAAAFATARWLRSSVFPPTGREFAAEQVHFCRIRDGLAAQHWAVRDDLGQAGQLGWIPPRPSYLWRCTRATRRARRSQS